MKRWASDVSKQQEHHAESVINNAASEFGVAQIWKSSQLDVNLALRHADQLRT